jgi:thiamine biosynthesis lipoprotein ApbE
VSPRPRRAAPLAVLPLAAPLAVLLLAAPLAAEHLRFTGRALDEAAAVEIAGLDRAAATTAATAAFEELARAERTVRSLAERAAAAAGGDLPLSGAELELLSRAHAFCLWSDGSVSALGGAAHRLWGVRVPVAGRPGDAALAAAARSARCAGLTLEAGGRILTDGGGAPAASGGTAARLAPEVELDLFPFETGWAVDQAVAALAAAGASNVRVALGAVARGAGPGPEGRGWPFDPPAIPGLAEPFSPLVLRDQAAAVLTAGDRSLALAGDPLPPYLDLRSARPALGVRLVAVVSPLALDARALAQAMFVLGPRSGQLSLGGLRPAPSVLWLVGGGAGDPVITSSNWSRVHRR